MATTSAMSLGTFRAGADGSTFRGSTFRRSRTIPPPLRAATDEPWEEVHVDSDALAALGIEEDSDSSLEHAGDDASASAEAEAYDAFLGELRFDIQGGELIQLDSDVSGLDTLEQEAFDFTSGPPDSSDTVADLAAVEDPPALKWSEARFDDESKAASDLEYLSRLDASGLDAESLAVLEDEMQRKAAEAESDGLSPASSTRRDESKREDASKPKRKTHRKLAVVAGACKGQKLLSPADSATRPMMGVVRGAIFGMLASLCGSSSLVDFPADSRWLDLYAGTGAVGLEALSRGVGSATFVESDKWCVNKCLWPNLHSTGSSGMADVHIGEVEPFLQQPLRSREAGIRRNGNDGFDFVSVCPPYRQVDYEQLLNLLEQSEQIANGALITVEYPLELRHLLQDEFGSMQKVRDRRYGRTFVAVYWKQSELQSS